MSCDFIEELDRSEDVLLVNIDDASIDQYFVQDEVNLNRGVEL